MVSPEFDSTGPVSQSPFVASRAVSSVTSLENRYVHPLSSLPERGPLISSRTRAKTAAAAGGAVTNPTYFGQQPHVTIIPRSSSPARRSNRSHLLLGGWFSATIGLNRANFHDRNRN